MIKDRVVEFKEIEDNINYVNCKFINYDHDINISDVIFDNCLFEDNDFSGSEWLDITFNNMDLSNKNFNESIIYRSKFNNCRMTGISLIDTRLKSDDFSKSQLDFCNFSGSKLNELNFFECSLNGMLFQEVEHQKKINFDKCSLNDTSFINTKMNQIDLSTSYFDNIELSIELIRGVTMNSAQLVLIADYLGIYLK
ncbi:hypothetical protein GSH19_06240 [Lactobacillus sp. S2-2]|uniref:pentapeptide repeat-containing protein n=1 Tax=Lactobacillus sp. S2-2 TaxID=2692917 RepID=UPI001F2D054B|nr:pentapeptide repeat-containing protein [Lactobacillus sp. S2-2]MCF6515745.1 hypothetical protein [Lactobacillus sp. S2-2]